MMNDKNSFRMLEEPSCSAYTIGNTTFLVRSYGFEQAKERAPAKIQKMILAEYRKRKSDLHTGNAERQKQ
ncbi:hypothetical protein [Porcincola intestinalis]|uniref:Uncharacterized protein n=1 Tax=Porcincola intestinalis TaxID=2606632 RepID=A0A6L5X9D0_9FIRM|nr:hypothetical protein [Porcincola intestinalis]